LNKKRISYLSVAAKGQTTVPSIKSKDLLGLIERSVTSKSAIRSNHQLHGVVSTPQPSDRYCHVLIGSITNIDQFGEITHNVPRNQHLYNHAGGSLAHVDADDDFPPITGH
jgi:hypothetical protein